MKITKVKIAKLVLGYLRGEKYQKTLNEFLEECKHLEEYKELIKTEKYVFTRIMGKSLINIVEEYAHICNLVQHHLETSDFYSDVSSSLVDQLQYLLEQINSQPPKVSKDVNATPAQELPGNSRNVEDDDDEYVPKAKRARTRSSLDKSIFHKTMENLDMSGVSVQPLLDNCELQEKLAEKLAENINIVRNTPESLKNVPSDDTISAGASQELDAVIKTVVQRTEEDPVYNTVINEIIGNATFDNNFSMKNYLSFGSTSQHHLEDPRLKLRSNKSLFIDDVNNDAVRSIMEASNNVTVSSTLATTAQSVPLTTPNFIPNKPVDSKNNSEVILYEGSIESYLKNTMGDCIVSAPITTPIDDSSKIFVMNNQQVVGSLVKNITDNDIMNMPTVIVNDSIRPKKRITNPPVEKKPTLKTIAPKLPKTAEEAFEYLKIVRMEKPAPKPKEKKKTSSVAIPKDTSKQTTTEAPSSKSKQSHITPIAMSVPKSSSTPRQGSHVRNLNFSTPLKATQLNQLTVKTGDPSSMVSENADSTNPTTTSQSLLKVVEASPPEPPSLAPPLLEAPPLEVPPLKTPPLEVPPLELLPSLEAPPLEAPPLEAPPPPEAPSNITDVKPKLKKAWDEDLRLAIGSSQLRNKTPPKKKPRRQSRKVTPSTRTSRAMKRGREATPSPLDPVVDVASKEDHLNESLLEEHAKKLEMNLQSPLRPELKHIMPKTPGGDMIAANQSLISKNNCTPFSKIIEDQLEGVDLTALQTPSLPITPGFALTPHIDPTYASRSTDYSATSSYYQPSDTEHNKSIEQLVEECRNLEQVKADTKVNILSDIAVKKMDKIPNEEKENHQGGRKNCSERLDTFNKNAIGKKNLNLVSSVTSDLSSSSNTNDSMVESDFSEEQSNKTVIRNTVEKPLTKESISEIIRNAEVKSIIKTNDNGNKGMFSDLEVVRKRTLRKIQSEAVKKPTPPKKSKNAPRKSLPKKNERPKRTSTRSSKGEPEEDGFVDWSRQRGIHLMQNNKATKKETNTKQETQSKPSKPKKIELAVPKTSEADKTIANVPNKEEIVNDNSTEDVPVFDKVTYADVIDIAHSAEAPKRALSEYNLELLNKSINADVFSEDLNCELVRRIHWTSFCMVLDLETKVNLLTPRRTKRGEGSSRENSLTPKGSDDLMDYVFSKSIREDSPEARNNKRKRRLSNEDKQIKNINDCKKLLNNIDMDVFLNKVHGKD